MGYSIFPTAAAATYSPTVPSLQHTITSTQTFTANGSPAVMYALVYGAGGGGGGTGGGPYSGTGSSGAGGSGGVVAGFVSPTMRAVTIGAAGTAGTAGATNGTGGNGGTGGTTSFAGLRATGGSGGNGGPTAGANQPGAAAGDPNGVAGVTTTGGVMSWSADAAFNSSTYCSGGNGVSGTKNVAGNAGKQGVVYIYY